MSTGQRPDRDPADVWEELVRQGVPKAEATKRVREMLGTGGATQGRARTAVGLLGKVAQGISLGTADEIAGAVLSPFAKGETWGAKYRSARDLARGVMFDAKERAPVAATVAEVGGAIAPAFIGAGAVLPRVAGAGFRRMAQRGAANVAEGAILSGAAAAGNAEGGAAERVRAAVRAAPTGAALGGALPAVAGTVGAAGRAIIPAITRRGVQRAANRVGAEALEASGRSTDDLLRAIDDAVTADKPLALMDRMGTAGRKAVRGARTTSSEAAQMLDDVAANRMPSAPGRVMDDVREGLGVGRTTPTRAAADAAERRATIGQQQFTPERMTAPVTSPEVAETLLASPVYRQAFDDMAGAAELRPRNAPDAAERVLEPLFGDEGLAREVTLRDVEMIRRGLDDMLATGRMTRVNPQTGRRIANHLTNEERAALQAARTQLMEDAGLNAEHGWYAPARGELDALHRQERALGTGSAMTAHDPMDVRDAMAAMGDDVERRGARVGFAASLARKVQDGAPVSAAATAGGGIGPTARVGRMDRLRAMAPDATRADRMAERLGAESEIANTERFLSGQSNTADKAMEGANLAMRALQAVQSGASAAANSAFFVGLNAAVHGNTGRVAAEVARRFSTMNRAEQRRIIEELAAEALRRAQRQAGGRATVRAAGALGGGGQP